MARWSASPRSWRNQRVSILFYYPAPPTGTIRATRVRANVPKEWRALGFHTTFVQNLSRTSRAPCLQAVSYGPLNPPRGCTCAWAAESAMSETNGHATRGGKGRISAHIFAHEKKGGEDGCEDNLGQEFAHAAGVRPGFGHNSILPPSR